MTTKYFNVKQGITTGNITLDAASGNISNANWVIANYYSGNGSSLSGIAGANVTGTVANANYAAYAGNVTVASQPNITSLGTLTSLVVGNSTANVTVTVGGANGTLTSTGNITAPYFIGNVVGNISGNIVVPGTNTSVLFNNDGNAGASSNFTFNKDTNVATINGNLITNNANLGNAATANYFIGNLWGTANAAVVANTVVDAAQPNITSVGTLTSLAVTGNASAGNLSTGGSLTVTGNASANNLSTTNLITAGNGLQVTTGSLSVLAGNLDVTGNINVTGNLNYSNVTDLVVGDPLIYIGANNTGDIYDLGIVGSYNEGTYQHTGIARNAADNYWTFFDGVVAEPTTVIDWANATYPTVKMGNLITTANANIGGNLVLTGTATAGNVYANSGTIGASLLTGTLTTAAQPNITSVGTLSSLSVSGNVTAGNLIGVFANGTSNVAIPSVNGNVNISSSGNANVVVVTGTGVNVAGTLNATSIVATSTVDFSTTSNVALGAVANVSITGGSAGYLLSTDGAGDLSWIAPPSTSGITNGTSNISIPTVNGNVNTSVGGTANVLVVTSTGANIAGTLNATGNANVGNIGATNGVFTNVSGNGSGLSSITGANVTGTVANATHASTANTVTDAAQPNITSVGTLTSVAVTGNATVGNIVLNGGIQSNRTNVSVSTSATVIDQFAPTTYRTAKYVISASSVDGYQSVETLLIHDGTSSYITVYGSICSNASVDIVEISSNLDGVSGNIRVYATSANATATVNLVATYLKT